jgi:uncharacterized protein YndB with AHSA1/START domain
MVDILHRVGIISSPDEVYTALTTVDGLANWWTEDTDGDSGVGECSGSASSPAAST